MGVRMKVDVNKEKEKMDEVVNTIKDEDIREWTRIMFKNAPEGFWYTPASPSGKYHPPDERLEGGTFRHSIRAFYILSKLCESLQDVYDENDCSMMQSAILLHDICGEFGRNHAELVRIYYEDVGLKAHTDKYPHIMNMIERHMGRWGKTPPKTNMEWLVHYADNIAANAHLIISANGLLNDILDG